MRGLERTELSAILISIWLLYLIQCSHGKVWEVDTLLPEQAAEPESYLCTRVDLEHGNGSQSLQIVGIEPLSSQKIVHHMLLFGCEADSGNGGVWPCQGHSVCPGNGNQQILYGWAKGAAAMHLPSNVSYKVGPEQKISGLVLQVHFAVRRPVGDASGIRVRYTDAPMAFSAGMQMYSSYFEIPPQTASHLVPSQCCYKGFEPARGLAVRVHTHALGRSVYLDEVLNNGTLRRIVEHDPQLPQGFNPVSNVTFWPGQKLRATCDFNSTERTEPTYAGATHHNEMCNLYMIMWSELPVFWSCQGGWLSADLHGPGGIPQKGRIEPELSQFWQVPAAADASHSAALATQMGQLSGVQKGLKGDVWILHRGSRVWDVTSFSGARGEHTTHKDPIEDAVIVQVNQNTGHIISQFGAGLFFMPHMISLDNDGNIWVTDVALHQVFKLDQQGNILLTLGSRLQPGTGPDFCKPTQVAISNNGTIFVSDGYCNSRVARFTPDGQYVGEYRLDQIDMDIPHSVLLDECDDSLLVADREHAQVHRFDLATYQHSGTYELANEGFVYGLATGPYGAVFALCWQRQVSGEGITNLVRLHANPGDGVAFKWNLPGVDSPHDIAVIAAPMRLAEVYRPIAVLVSETRTTDSRLHKFILLPEDSPSLELQTASTQTSADVGDFARKTQHIPLENRPLEGNMYTRKWRIGPGGATVFIFSLVAVVFVINKSWRS